MISIRSIVKLFVPPIVVNMVHKVHSSMDTSPPEWEYLPGGWRLAQDKAAVRGWNVADAVEGTVARMPVFLSCLEPRIPFGACPETVNQPLGDLTYHNTVAIFGYALSSSLRMKKRVRILDWGGGVGNYYAVTRALLPDVELDYHIVELEAFVARGRQLFPDVHFHADDAWRQQQYDFVFSSGSLNFLEDWRQGMSDLTGVAKGGSVFITRLPVVFQVPSYLFVQRPHKLGLNTEYVSWSLNKDEFMGHAASLGLKKRWEFVAGERPYIVNAPEQCEYRAYLFDGPA
jgi:putative methyltransferase (TIGR04325 family)